MKKIMPLLIVSLLAGWNVFGQTTPEEFIQEALNHLQKKDYGQAQLSLQDAIREINLLQGNQVADALPDEINGLRAVENGNTNTGAMGIMGIGAQISKSYRHPSKKENEAEIQILMNSPMLSMLNMYVSNPSIMGPEYKSIRVGSRRAILKSEMSDYYDDTGAGKKIRSSEIQIPLSQTLITVTLRGFASEQEELAFVGKFDLEKLRTLLGE